MIQLRKRQSRFIPLGVKLKLLENVIEKKPFSQWKIHFRAIQMQELRDFLMLVLRHVYYQKHSKNLDEEKIKAKMLPIQTYYQSMDCREPLFACFNESCLGSNPACFSNKMKGQIEVILEELYPLMDFQNEQHQS